VRTSCQVLISAFSRPSGPFNRGHGPRLTHSPMRRNRRPLISTIPAVRPSSQRRFVRVIRSPRCPASRAAPRPPRPRDWSPALACKSSRLAHEKVDAQVLVQPAASNRPRPDCATRLRPARCAMETPPARAISGCRDAGQNPQPASASITPSQRSHGPQTAFHCPGEAAGFVLLERGRAPALFASKSHHHSRSVRLRCQAGFQNPPHQFLKLSPATRAAIGTRL
jgi:hypothetical protein